ncbi:MAG: cytochrome c [Alphaproteobacteria bacterium]|nr:cytochrome c [Alphaproteobacteria bacterium]
MSLKRGAVLLVLAVVIGIAGYSYLGEGHLGDADDGGGPPIAAVSMPETLSARARAGQRAYDANCASCHGRNAAGQDGVAPPLVHVIYEPGHHGDESFQRAVARGVRAHHWRFGDMPPVEGLTRRDVAGIVAYVRELQHANGIR